MVRREQLATALWPEDTFVDFEHGVNTAVKKLRQALEDSAEHPKFVETLPKVGYRYIFPVEWVGDGGSKGALPSVVEMPLRGPTAVPPVTASEEHLRPGSVPWRFALLVIGPLLLAGFGGYLLRPRRQTSPKR